MVQLTAKEKITRSKVQLNKTSPFFAYIVMHMNFREEKGIPSMGVDADGHVFYNAKFVDKLSNDEVIAVVCHEAMHVALQHMNRLNGRQRDIHNVATDLSINGMLQKNKLKLPKDCLIPSEYDDSFEITGKKGKYKIKEISKKTSEEIYDIIYKNAPTIKIKGFDIHKYGDGKGKDGKSNKVANGQKWGRIMSEAYNYAKNQGKAPLGAGRMIDGILDHKMNWKSLLQKYITQTLPYDYTYCVDKHTNITTDKGTKQINDLAIGNTVIGYKNKKLIKTKVESIFRGITKPKKYVIYTKKGNRIICSENHRFLVGNKYVKAKDLKIAFTLSHIKE